MGALIAKFIAPYEVYIWAAAAVALLGLGLWAVHHEREIGRQQVIAADAAARVDEDKKIAVQQAALQAAADKAESDRVATQAVFDSYMREHPTGHVFVCHPGDQQPKSPVLAGQSGGAQSAGTGSGAGLQVPDGSGSQATDIGPELDTIVQGFGRLAILYKDLQSQPTVGK